MCPEEEQVRVGPEYPFGQLAKAFVTALTHEDAETRERAERRADRWLAVLDGMASGRLAIGSRTPVADLPAWVTPEVIRGGFATGSAAAGIPLEPWERIRAREAGVERTRAGSSATTCPRPASPSSTRCSPAVATSCTRPRTPRC
jgi:hypothetical protein